MNWFIKEGRGPGWKQGWKAQTLASITPPPSPLLTIFCIVILFLSLSHYTSYRSQMHNTGINFKLLLFLLPVLLIIAAKNMSSDRRFVFRVLPRAEHDFMRRAGSGSVWGMVAVVVVLLVMALYQPYFQSKWFRPMWMSNY